MLEVAIIFSWSALWPLSVVSFSKFVPYLATWPSSAILAPMDEAPVPVDSNLSLVYLCRIEAVQSNLSSFPRGELDECKSTRLLCLLVESHDDSFNFCKRTKIVVDLGLGSEKRQIADVQGRRGIQSLLVVVLWETRLSIEVFWCVWRKMFWKARIETGGRSDVWNLKIV